MKDLVDVFFERDLTEPEKTRLSELLSSSDEALFRFIRLGTETYQATGLPKPRWPGKPMAFPGEPAGGLFKPILCCGILGLGALGFIYHWITAVIPAAKTPVAAQINGANEHVPKPAFTPLHLSALVSKPSPVFTPLPLVIFTPPPTPYTASFPTPGSTPISVAGKHQELSVEVDLKSTGVVTVRVLDSQNAEVRMIYTGILPPGQKTFTWDGSTDEGKAAVPGTYSIEVQSDARTMRKQVLVEPGQ